MGFWNRELLARALADKAYICVGANGKLTICDNSVDSPKIKDGGVQEADILDGAVSTSKLADGAVTATKIADGAVNKNKLYTATGSSTGSVGGGVYVNIYLNPFSFFPCIASEVRGQLYTVAMSQSDASPDKPCFAIYFSSSANYYVYWRYVTASRELVYAVAEYGRNTRVCWLSERIDGIPILLVAEHGKVVVTPDVFVVDEGVLPRSRDEVEKIRKAIEDGVLKLRKIMGGVVDYVRR